MNKQLYIQFVLFQKHSFISPFNPKYDIVIGQIFHLFSFFAWHAQGNVKFIYSEKATKFCEISTLLLTGTTYDKSKVGISQNFLAFSEYMNFKKLITCSSLNYFYNLFSQTLFSW